MLARFALISGKAVRTVSPSAGWVDKPAGGNLRDRDAAPPLVAPLKFAASLNTFGLFAFDQVTA